MATEIERKFLLKNELWRNKAEGTLFRQGYLSFDIDRTVRVRIVDKKAYLTIKGRNNGATRMEFEYEIPFDDGCQLLDTMVIAPIIEKTRYHIAHNHFNWVVDEFFGDNKGLIIAEIELSHENEAFNAPEWIGLEVTHDPRYFNSNLVAHPFSRWPEHLIASHTD